MRKLIAVTLGLVAVAALAVPGTAAANQVDRVAKSECKAERASEPGEFAAQYGGLGKAALKKCARVEKRDATRECKADRATEPAEFRAEYGGMGDAALRRCKIDELR